MALPINVSRLSANIHINVSVENELEFEGEFQKEFTEDMAQERHIPKNNYFANKLLQDELRFNVIMTIMKLYDLNDNVIPKSRWNEYNVKLESPF